MSVTHTNRRGDVYHLHEGTTRGGKPRYHFSRKTDGTLVAEIPAGYQVYENPRGQVFLRKVLRSRVRDDEVEACRTGIERFSRLKTHEFLLNVGKDAIDVYLLDHDLSALVDWLTPRRKLDAAALARTHGNYTAMLRFVLAHEDPRLFVAERFCFLGGVDD